MKDAYGVGAVQHVVHRLVVEIDAGEIGCPAGALLDEEEGILHLGEGPQSQEVDFDEASVVDGVLVPMAHVAAVDGPFLHRHLVYEGRGGDNHASGVLGEVLGKAVQLARQIHQMTPDRGIHLVAELRHGRHILAQMLGLAVFRPLG